MEDFETLLIRCADRAYNFAYRLAGNDQDARDMVQEAFARAFEHKDKYDPKRPLAAWVNRILHNVFIDSVRKYEHKHKVSIDASPSGDDDFSWQNTLPGNDEDPVEGLLKAEEQRKLQEALAQLPIHYRAAVVMSDIEGLDYAEIAKIMNIPIGTVCSRIYQGRQLLRKKVVNYV